MIYSLRLLVPFVRTAIEALYFNGNEKADLGAARNNSQNCSQNNPFYSIAGKNIFCSNIASIVLFNFVSVFVELTSFLGL